MKTKFETALEFTLKYEGGYVDHPSDPGGATNHGITLRTAKENAVDVDKDGDTEKEDMKKLPLETAMQIYKAQYWNVIRGDDYPVGYACSMFDASVNHGPTQALKWHLVAKGDTRRYNELRTTFYITLAKQERFKPFFKGWMNRITDLKKYVTIVEQANAEKNKS